MVTEGYTYVNEWKISHYKEASEYFSGTLKILYFPPSICEIF